MTSTTTTPLTAASVDLITSRDVDRPATLWRLEIFRGLFHLSRELLIAAPTKYHAACVADQVITGDEWFPSFSAEPVDTDIDGLLNLSGGDPR